MWYSSGSSCVRSAREMPANRSLIRCSSIRQTGRMLHAASGLHRWGSTGWRSQLTSKVTRSEEHTSELQSRLHLVCRLLLEKKKKKNIKTLIRNEIIDQQITS